MMMSLVPTPTSAFFVSVICTLNGMPLVTSGEMATPVAEPTVADHGAAIV